MEGYINIDIRETPATDRVSDIRKLDYPKDSIEEIQAHHVIEHISWTEVYNVLHRWFELLKPGGKIVLSTPDAKEAFTSYLNSLDWIRLNRAFYGAQRDVPQCHKCCFDLTSLSLALERVGFVGITRAMGLPSHWEDFDLCLQAKKPKNDSNNR